MLIYKNVQGIVLHQNFCAFARYLSTLAIFICTIIPLQVNAQTSPQVARGLAWLSAQVQADGSLQNEAVSIATPFQNRAEAALTLRLLATLPPSLASSVNGDNDNNTQYLARKLIALTANGGDVSNILTLLLQLQNADGGFGGALGYASEPGHTAWAVLGLAQAGLAGSDAANSARALLRNQLDADGGMRANDGFTRTYLSGMALMALQTAPASGNGTAIKGLSSWLLQQQGADGSWQGNLFLSASTLTALTPVLTDASVRISASNFLLAAQNANGSWGDDPFLTAVVLRALAGQAGNVVPGGSGLSIFKAKVVDRATNAGLPGVSVTLSGTGNLVVTTDATGNFNATNLAAGAYSLTFARTGYAAVSGSATAIAGQTTDLGIVSLAQLSGTAIIRGQVVAAGTATPLAGVTVAVTGASTASTSTDANGRYELTGITPGAVSISATLSGYQSATGTATAVAAQTLIFSPTLYLNNTPAPTTLRYLGKVVVAGQSTPLAGVALQLTGAASATALTGANGQFDLTLNPGAYVAGFSLSGYGGVTQTFVGSAGAVIDAGLVGLSPIRSKSSISGQVLNSSRVAIAGATVQIVGSTKSAVTNADGRYLLDNLEGLTFSLRAAATGYNSQSINLQLSAPTDVAQDLTLTQQTAGALTLGDLVTTPASVGSNQDVAVRTSVSNSGTTPAATVLQLQILDTQNKLIGTAGAVDENGHPLGQLSLQPGQTLPAKMVWNSAQFTPGAYTLVVRLIEPGSITRATPQGNAVAERASSVTVTGQAHFSGTITANPPVARAGTNTAIKLSAALQNDGNIDLPLQAYTLNAINTKDNTLAHTETVSGASLPVAGLTALTFADWTPTDAGDYRLELVAQDPAMGKLTGTLYIGDSVKAGYTVNKPVVPTGNQSVRANVSITGQDVTSGSISDPLAPLIKAAVNKAVRFNYSVAVDETLSSRCLRCHVQSQALVGGELTRKLTNSAEINTNRDTILNAITTHLQSNGAIDGYGGYQKTQSMLSMWAMNAWHNSAEVLSTLVSGSDFLVNNQNANGSWDPDHASGWWSTQMANAAFNVKNLAETVASARKLPGVAQNYVPAVVVDGVGGPYHAVGDGSGNIYVSNYYSGNIFLISPNGASQTYTSGVSNPTALVPLADGSAYIASLGGLYKRNVDGSKSLVAQIAGSGLAMGPDGNLYMASYWANKIYKVTPLGEVTDYVVGGGLNSPWGVAFSAAGDLMVASYGGQSILRYHADLSYDVVVPWIGYAPRNLQETASGWLASTDAGLFAFNREWHGERRTFTALGGVAVTPDGKVYVGDVVNNRVVRLDAVASDTPTFFAKTDASISKGTAWLLDEGNAAGANNLMLAQRLIGLNAAKNYYQGQPIADTLQSKMQAVGAQLRALVNADGGWGWATGYGSDSLVTAQVGWALDSLNPSASDPIVQNAVKWLLSRQRADGTWYSEDGILSTPQATTTWVAIWLPVVLDRLGGVDTDLSISFPANVTMSNPDIAPASVTANSDGSSTALWHLIGVTSAGRQINYDLGLQNLIPNEVRPVSTDAHLTFKNSFTNGVVTTPLDIPRVTAKAFLGLGVSTDKASYEANSLVTINALVNNTGVGVAGGSVKLEVYAPDNHLITSIAALPFSGLAPAASVNLNANWNTATYAAAPGYFVKATLLDANGQLVSSAQSLFAISAGAGSGASLGAAITTDKQTYQPGETVRLNDRVNNVSVNAGIDNLQITVGVKNADGAVVFSKTEALPQLAASGLKDYSYSLPLNPAAAAGIYSATVSASSASAGLLAQAATQFKVASSATSGSGLSGKISANPQQAKQGEVVALSFSAVNGGNSVLTGLPLTISIIDPVTQTVITSFASTQNLPVGATYNGANSWAASGTVGRTYVAVLSATVGGNKLTLAQDNITLVAPLVKLDISQQGAAWQNLLVFSRCKRAADELAGQCGAKALPVEDPAKLAQCDLDRANALDQSLNAAGVAHKVTSSPAEFLQSLRGGLYNTYWVSNGATSIRELASGELRAALVRGNGLVIDGLGDGRNTQLTQCAAVAYRNAYAVADQPMSILVGVFAAGDYRITASPVVLQASGGTAQAKLGPVATRSDGIVSATLGSGKSLAFGFDWADTLRAQKSDSRWLDVTQKSFGWVKPAADSNQAIGDQVVTLGTVIHNSGQSASLQVLQTVPAGAQIIATEPAAQVVTATSATWNLNLAANADSNLRLRLRVPSASGTASVATTVNVVKDGVTSPFKTLQYDLTVRSASDLLTQFISDITALKLTTAAQLAARVTILDELNRTRQALQLNHSIEALRRLLSVQSRLVRIDTNGVQAASVARVIASVEVQSTK